MAVKLNPSQATQSLSDLHSDWKISPEGTLLTRVFSFKGYAKTMGFINAVAWIAQQSVHHPDLQVSFNQCVVNYTTHDEGGLTDLDFSCAKKVDLLLE